MSGWSNTTWSLWSGEPTSWRSSLKNIVRNLPQLFRGLLQFKLEWTTFDNNLTIFNSHLIPHVSKSIKTWFKDVGEFKIWGGWHFDESRRNIVKQCLSHELQYWSRFVFSCAIALPHDETGIALPDRREIHAFIVIWSYVYPLYLKDKMDFRSLWRKQFPARCVLAIHNQKYELDQSMTMLAGYFTLGVVPQDPGSLAHLLRYCQKTCRTR